MKENHSQPPEELWNIDQLAEYLGVGRRYVYRITSEHRIAFVRLGRELRFDPADVAAFLAAERVAVGPAKPPPPPDAVRPARRRPGRPRSYERSLA